MAKAAVFGVVENGVSNINKRYFEHIHQSGVDTFVPYPKTRTKHQGTATVLLSAAAVT